MPIIMKYSVAGSLIYLPLAGPVTTMSIRTLSVSSNVPQTKGNTEGFGTHHCKLMVGHKTHHGDINSPPGSLHASWHWFRDGSDLISSEASKPETKSMRICR